MAACSQSAVLASRDLLSAEPFHDAVISAGDAALAVLQLLSCHHLQLQMLLPSICRLCDVRVSLMLQHVGDIAIIVAMLYCICYC